MTVIQNPGSREVQAAFIKGHLKMMRLGMKNSGISKTQMLAKAAEITGVKKYPRGDAGIATAIADLQKIVDEAKAQMGPQQ